MVEVSGLENQILNIYNSLLGGLSPTVSTLVNLFLVTLVIVVYSIFVWNFYTVISKKNIVKLNLSQYNRSEYPALAKFLGFFLYVVEYILILPLLIFVWFILLSALFVLMTENPIHLTLLISAGVIAAIRITAYYSHDLSKDLAKIIPLTLLGIAITTTQNFFSFERIIGQIGELFNITAFLSSISIYLVFIIALEFVMRILEFFMQLTQGNTESI